MPDFETKEQIRARMMIGTADARRGPRLRLNDGYKALGLETRGMAITLVLIGVVLPIVFTIEAGTVGFMVGNLIGIPLMIWGIFANWMLVRHQRGD